MKTIGLFAAAMLISVAPLCAQQPAPPPPKSDAEKKAEKKKEEAEKPKVDLSKKLKFMEGCWAGRLDKDTSVEELWSTASENLLLSYTRYLKKEHATGWEFSRIESNDSAVTFSAFSSGKPGEEDSYTMKTLADGYVVFENLKKQFPQKIIYREASDGSLIPRNEGDGPSVELRFIRIKCPGADIKIKA